MKDNFIELEVQNEITLANSKFKENSRALGLWNNIRIVPKQWEQYQYPETEKVWVIGILGQHCLYFNFVEEGWGWGSFEEWGKVTKYHFEQDELFTTVLKTLYDIEHDRNI